MVAAENHTTMNAVVYGLSVIVGVVESVTIKAPVAAGASHHTSVAACKQLCMLLQHDYTHAWLHIFFLHILNPSLFLL